jgi:long-chain acyl-CoA synthetase
VELRIVEPDGGSDRPHGEVGELWTRSLQNMKGYWHKPEETERTITEDGWLRTGDAGYIDHDGFVYLHDRVKDMIISGGENVYSAEVENVISLMPGVGEVAVIGIPDERWGETVHAIVVPKQGVTLAADEVIEHCREQIAGYKCPRSVDFRDTPLPLSGAGKVLKRELREPYWKGFTKAVN